MLAPKRVKHRKQHRGRMRGKAKGHTEIQYGDYAHRGAGARLDHEPPDRGRRVAMTRHIKRGGKVWITIFPDKPVTKKPAETRMGSGKGNPEGWVAVVKPGPRDVRARRRAPSRSRARRCFARQHKLPIKTKFITQGGGVTMPSKAAELRELPDDELLRRASRARRRSCSTCGSSSRPGSSTTPRGSRSSATTSRV